MSPPDPEVGRRQSVYKRWSKRWRFLTTEIVSYHIHKIKKCFGLDRQIWSFRYIASGVTQVLLLNKNIFSSFLWMKPFFFVLDVSIWLIAFFSPSLIILFLEDITQKQIITKQIALLIDSDRSTFIRNLDQQRLAIQSRDSNKVYSMYYKVAQNLFF